MKHPTVSVCVATYNQRDLIETCLRSILDQEVDANVQVMVGDDASTDGTSDVIRLLAEEYSPRLKHCLRGSNLGAAANMCDLLSCVDGEFVARVDGDDYWLPGKLARQLAYLQENPGCAGVYSNAITVDDATNRIGLFNDVGDACFDLAGLLRRGNALNNSSVLFRVEYIHGWRDITEQIDYQAHLWLAQRGWLGHIGEPLAAYRVNTQGSMVFGMNEAVRELYWQAIQSVPRDLVADDDYAHGLADFLRRVFFRALRTHDARLFRSWASRVFAASPYGPLRTSALMTSAIVRIAGKMLVGRLLGGNHRHILYRH